MYGKIFSSIYDGTLGEHWQALVTFQQMCVLCDAQGVLDMTPQALSSRTGIPLRIIKAGLTILEAPDPQSRTPEEAGRRLLRLSDHREWGWQIVNYGKYRELRSATDRREYMRDYMREYRKPPDGKQQGFTDANSKPPLTPLAEAEAEAEAITTSTQRADPFADLALLVQQAPDRFQITEYVEARSHPAVWAKTFCDWITDGVDMPEGKCITVGQLGRAIRDLATKPRASQDNMLFVRSCVRGVVAEDRREGQRRGPGRPSANFKAPERRAKT